MISSSFGGQSGRRRKQDAAAAPQFTDKPRTKTLCFYFSFLCLLHDAETSACCTLYLHWVNCSRVCVALEACLPSRRWSSGVNCSVRATAMLPSPTWRLHSETDWLFVRLSINTDRIWCKCFTLVKFWWGLIEHLIFLDSLLCPLE